MQHSKLPSESSSDYSLLDSGHQQKLERFGKVVLIRPSLQALWPPTLSEKQWEIADASFSREDVEKWCYKKSCPPPWEVTLEEIRFQLQLTPFGHVGVFPEHAPLWVKIRQAVGKRKTFKMLNLFAYSGGATLAGALAGAEVTHLDASKKSIQQARENAALNGLEKHPIRWILDDAKKYMLREIRRGVTYDGILMDPPTFGRGAAGEIFKIEEEISFLMEGALRLLSPNPSFFIFSTHTPGYTPLVLEQLFRSYFPKGTIESGELFLQGSAPYVIPSGSFAIWHNDD